MSNTGAVTNVNAIAVTLTTRVVVITVAVSRQQMKEQNWQIHQCPCHVNDAGEDIGGITSVSTPRSVKW